MLGRRLGFVLAVTLGALYVSAPTFIYFSMPKSDRGDAKKVSDAIPNWLPEKLLVKLGLDLQGGVQLVLGVNTDGAIETKLGRIGTEVMRWKEDFKIPVKTAYVVKGKRLLRVELDEGADLNAFRDKFKQEYAGLEQASRDGNAIDFAYNEQQNQHIKQSSLEQAERVIRNRIDKWGVSEPMISRRADGSVLVQLPGFSDPNKARELLGRTAQLQLKIVDETFAGFAEIAAQQHEGITVENPGPTAQAQFVSEDKAKLLALLSPKVPSDRELLFEEERIAGGRKSKYRSYVVMAATEISGDDILDSGISTDSGSLDPSPVVTMRFTGPGGKRFADITGANVNKRMAIVLDSTVVSAPNIESKISGGSCVIRLGRGTYQEKYDEANQLSLILKSGALPATIEVQEERQVGATLGPELAQQGIYSILVGLFFVLLFMLVYYQKPGFLACIALVLNALFMLAFMAMFGFSLSLPGIAGFILTLGMAVDANVLINERIRQELREGKPGRKAVTLGFDKVFWTIVDANVTSLIAALVLLETSSSGPIRGFAVTLIIGLSVSIFTALYCTKIFFDLALQNLTSDTEIKRWVGGQKALSTKIFNFNFMRIGPATVLGGAVVVLAALLTMGLRGMNWSVDFAGGTEMEVRFAEVTDTESIRKVVQDSGVGDATFQSLGEDKKAVLIRFDHGSDANASSSKLVNDKVADAIRTNLASQKPDIQRIDYVGPQVGKELRTQGVMSLLWALIGIFIYVGLRFDLRFAPGAIVKMIQDAFIVLAFYIFFHRSFDLTSIAALLTVVGYSVNDVIVIYDRIRENLQLHPRRKLVDNINLALNETLTRSLNTSLATLVSLVGVLIFGTAQIWNFAAAMAVGVCAATFSSTFLASTFILWFEDWKSKRKSSTQRA